MENIEKAIKYFGECTAYSAKGHFKSADLRRLILSLLIGINILFSVLTMLDIFCDLTIKIMGVISLLASIMILLYQSKDEADFISDSMRIGNEYLKLHNEIFVIYSKGNFTSTDVEKINEKINELNTIKKPSILFFAKTLAKRSIEKSGEMNIWWK